MGLPDKEICSPQIQTIRHGLHQEVTHFSRLATFGAARFARNRVSARSSRNSQMIVEHETN